MIITAKPITFRSNKLSTIHFPLSIMKTLFILLLFSFSLYSQVIIKERLEIHPTIKIPLVATNIQDSNVTWIDIYYYYHLYYYPYTPWPGMGGLTQLELSTGQVDTIALNARFPGRTVWMVRSPTIGPVPLGTTAEVKNYNGAEYNYGISPPYPTTSISYQQTSPTSTDVYRSINYTNGSSGPSELHGTIYYTPVPKPTVSITGTKIKQYTISSQTTTFPIASYTYSATPSGKYAPTITWAPQQTINTQNYLNQIKPGDTLRIPVKVTATNIAGSISDTTGKLILIRPNELHHIKVFVNPDSLNYGDSAVVTVRAYRSDSTDITSTLPGNTPVSFAVDKPELAELTYTTAPLGDVLAGKVKVKSPPTNTPPLPIRSGELNGIRGTTNAQDSTSIVTVISGLMQKIAQTLLKTSSKKFTPCQNLNNFADIVEHTEDYSCNGTSTTGIHKPDNENYIVVNPCLNDTNNCVKYEVTQVGAAIWMSLCDYSSKTKIESPDDVTNLTMAKAVVKEFKDQLQQIDKVMKRFAKAEEGEEVDALIVAENYVSREAARFHEQVHVQQFREKVIPYAIDSAKTWLKNTTSCIPVPQAQNITIQDAQQKSSDASGAFFYAWKDYLKKNINSFEAQAHKKHKEFLLSLLNAIEIKFHLPITNIK